MKKPLSVPAAIDFYLTSRRRLGFALTQEGWLLGTLAHHARENHHRGPLTAELVLRWAQLPQPADPLWWARRLAIARQFESCQGYAGLPCSTGLRTCKG
jgi:hypothetical protein